ncbi:ABC transporter permease [Candidatus Aerophobetes bacterium]|nr:ABC transporter permease [Candidatus Aerophobetes bacterium]
MREYLIKRIIIIILLIWTIVTVNFVLFRMIPGDPVRLLFFDPRITAEAQKKLASNFGLDKPLYGQYFIYLSNLVKGDWGKSFLYREPVLGIVTKRLFNTLILLVPAVLLAVIIGNLLGVIAAWKRGTKIDTSILSFVLICWSLPAFWLGIVLIIVFINIFPISGMTSVGSEYLSIFQQIKDVLYHMILPLVTESIVLVGEYTLIMRGTLSEVLTEDYITTAKSKGFGDFYILRNHAVPNAMLPMITLIAINFGLIVGGAIQVETVFSWPGVGRLMYDSIMTRDYPVLQGTFLVVAIAVVLVNFMADILYPYFDPRVKLK